MIKKLSILFAALSMVACSSIIETESPLNVSTFNMRCDAEGASKIWKGAWNLRKVMITQMLVERDMDIVASQELYANQLTELKGLLAGKYDYVETQLIDSFDKSLIVGRNRPKADDIEIRMHNAIWYKVSKFKVLEKGSFYLSSTPDKFSFGFEPEAQCRRCVWVKFENLKSGREFYVFNVHADWEKRFSRLSAAKLTIDKIGEIAGNSTAILMGDFNDETLESAEIFTRDGKLLDSRAVSQTAPTGPFATYHLWGTRDADNPNDRLDYIFVPKSAEVLSYKVLNDSNGGVYPSDHYPILIKVRLK